jgi:hypothetical protein
MVRDGEVAQRKEDAIAGLLCGDEDGGEDVKRTKEEEDKDESAGQRVKKE